LAAYLKQAREEIKPYGIYFPFYPDLQGAGCGLPTAPPECNRYLFPVPWLVSSSRLKPDVVPPKAGLNHWLNLNAKGRSIT